MVKGYTITSSCPKCGAPIYAPDICVRLLPPAPMFTCECRHKQEHIEELLIEIKHLLNQLILKG